MIDAEPRIRGRKVICHGSLVINQNDYVELFPIPSDRQYCIRFHVDYGDDLKNDVNFSTEGDKTVVIRIRRKGPPGSMIGGFGTSEAVAIAVEDDKETEYAVSFLIDAVGPSNQYTAVLNYTFIERPLTVEIA